MTRTGPLLAYSGAVALVTQACSLASADGIELAPTNLEQKVASQPEDAPPWLASIQEELPQARAAQGMPRATTEAPEWRHLCGGALIRKDVVLTAAHCVEHLERAHLRVVVGESVALAPSSHGQVAESQALTIHPGRQSPDGASVRDYDVALMFLKDSILHGHWLKLATTAFLESHMQSEAPSALFAGWGKTGISVEPGRTLRSFNLALFTPQEAPIYSATRESWKGLLVSKREEGGVCQFDSGGPLVRPGEEPVLLGIASGTATEKGSWLFPCKVGAFVRADKVKAWVEASLSNETSQSLTP